MKEALDSERCPLDANLEKVIPGLHQWHKANNDVVKGMDKRLTEGLEGLERKVQLGFEGLVAALRDERQRTDDRMADMLADMAAKLRSGDTNLQSIRKRPREDTPTLGLGNSPSDGGESLGDQVATEPTNDNEEPWKHIDHSSYTMTMKHSSLTNMYEEWYGLGKYTDKFGGIDGRERLFSKKHKSKWRHHLDGNHFSRTRRLVQGIVVYSTKNNVSHYQACAELEHHWVEAKQSLTKTVAKFQSLGLLGKQKDRGRRMKTTQTQDGSQQQPE